MLEKGVTEEAAVEHVKGLINESWKKLNKHLILGSPFPSDFVRKTMDFYSGIICMMMASGPAGREGHLRCSTLLLLSQFHWRGRNSNLGYRKL